MPISTEGSGSASNKIILEALMIDNVSAKNELIQAQIEKTRKSTELMTQTQTKQTAAVKNSVSSWTEFRSMYSSVVDVVRVGEQVWNATGQAALDYADKVRKIEEVTSLDAESSSRLIQVSDDLKLSTEDLTKAQKKLADEGLSLSIDTLAKLSDQYLAIQEPAAKAKFLTDNFGRAGYDLAEAMSKGGAAIREMNNEVEKGLILTQKEVDAARENQIAVDNLKDKYQALAITVGNEMIPTATKLVTHYSNITDSLKENGYWYTLLHQFSIDEIADNEKRANAIDSATNSYTAMAESMATSYTEATDTMAAFTQSNDDMIKGVLSIADSNKKYAESQSEIKQKQDEIITQMATAWGPELEDLQSQYDELGVKYEENATKHEEATQRILFNMTLEKIAMSDGVAGFSDAEAEKALALAQTAGAADAAAIREQLAMDQVSSAIAAGIIQIADFQAAWDLLTSKEITLTVNQVGNMLAADSMSVQQDYRASHAGGGSFMIPQSYGNEGFRMGGSDTASGGELVTITPRGGSPNADIVAAIERNSLDVYALARAISTEILRAVK